MSAGQNLATLEVLRGGTLCSVQDLGRHGLRHLGISQCGAMDPLALQQANLLLGNAPGAAGLELSLGPVQLLFSQATRIALTGVDFAARLQTPDGDELAVLNGHPLPVQAGAVLSLPRPAIPGARGYLAVTGGIEVPVLLGLDTINLRVAADRHANHVATEDHAVVDVALKSKLRAPLDANLNNLRHQDEPLLRQDRQPEANIIHATKAEKVSGQQFELPRIEASQLSGAFAHDDTRHQREAGHVALNPELVLGHIFETNQTIHFTVDMNDARELLHLMALRVDLANLIDVVEWLIEIQIELTDVKQCFGTHR